jgi:hypothetical protein
MMALDKYLAFAPGIAEIYCFSSGRLAVAATLRVCLPTLSPGQSLCPSSRGSFMLLSVLVFLRAANLPSIESVRVAECLLLCGK